MRAKAFFTILAASLSIHVHSQITDGLVAYYPFNGNAYDMTGNGHNGVINGNTISATTNRWRYANTALHFGGGSYISVTPTPINVNADWTISFWCLIDANGAPDNFVSTGNDNQSGLNIRYVYGSLTPWQFIAGNIGSGTSWTGTNAATVWNMVTVVRTGNLFEGFFNGARVTSTNMSFTMQDVGSLWFGREEVGSPYDLVGSMSDISIYDRGLSTNEVQQLYTYESTRPCSLHRATATATMTNGFVIAVDITDGGCGYTNIPQVLIQGGGGTGATAVAVVNNGVVTGITMTSAGINYTSTPTVYIYAPAGPQVGLLKAVQTTFTDLFPGSKYQLQVSADLNTWTNQGSPFTATNAFMTLPQYWNVDNWNQLYFRLQAVP